MDKKRRKELKNEGKRLVEEYSQRVRERLHRRNPFPVGDPNWVANLQAEYEINRHYRKNKLEVLREEVATENADLRVLDFKFEENLFPRAGQYVLCHACRCLVPTACAHAMGCECRAVTISPEARHAVLPPPDLYSVVELIGRGPNRKQSYTFPWNKR